jgi:DNA transposition AAA+ family ATPase
MVGMVGQEGSPGLTRRASRSSPLVAPNRAVADHDAQFEQLASEADRLKTAGLEQVRDMYDRRHLGLVLIGMPGLQKRPARYARLYSRVGFVHPFLPLGGAELRNLIRGQSQQLGLGLELHGGTDTSILSSIVRITGGNFRLVGRLFAQIQRVAQINDVTTLTPELVAAAQESLVIGAL